MNKLAPKPAFLNVDLDITSGANLDAIADVLGKRVMVLFNGPISRNKHLLALEIFSIRKNPDTTIHKLCDLIESLPTDARRKWDAAEKEFDIGYDLRPAERYSRFTLRNDTVKRVADLGAGIAVTYYRGEEDEISSALDRKKKDTKKHE